MPIADRAEAIVETFSGELARNFFPLATLLNNAELLAEPVQIVLAGEPGDPAAQALRRVVYAVSLPNRVVHGAAAGPRAAGRSSGARQGPRRGSPRPLMSATARCARCR